MRVFVTGGTGFVGSRLVECLVQAYGAEVHALVRRFDTVGMARLARLKGVRTFYGDILDGGAVIKAAEGCAYIVHCATGISGNTTDQERATVEGTRNVLDAALRHRIEHVVYFSSSSVHDPARSGLVITEDSPLNATASYARVKILAESVIDNYRVRHHLPVVVLRPTCIWGPYSRNWTIAPVEMIRKRIPFLPLKGEGSANAVYVDNLVDATYLALMKPEAMGRTFLVNDDEPKTWGQLYGGYAECLGVPLSLQYPGTKEMLRVSLCNTGLILRKVAMGRAELGLRTLREAYDHVPAAKLLVGTLPERLRTRLKGYAGANVTHQNGDHSDRSQAAFLGYSFISSDVLEAYGTSGRYANDTLKRVLGWRPRTSFDEALTNTCQWLEYAGYMS